MLYVFQVDTGMMITFDMRLAMDTVGNLRKAIAIKTDIPDDKQVLLISGGESLNSLQRVCSYSSAGTDTSPIFLFAKINIESNQPPMPNVDYGDDTDMTEMIESCMSMQPSLDTLVARTELAADLNEQATKQKEICERLVHDQHLQQQGWAAVIANLEDLKRAFKNKAEMLMLAFSEFTKCKPSHRELLNKFEDDIKHLDNIPILPALLENSKMMPPLSSNLISGGQSTSQTSQRNQDQPRLQGSSMNPIGKGSPKSKSNKQITYALPENRLHSLKVATTSHTSNTSESTSSGTNSGSFKSSSISSGAHSKASHSSLDNTNPGIENDENISKSNQERTDKTESTSKDSLAGSQTTHLFKQINIDKECVKQVGSEEFLDPSKIETDVDGKCLANAQPMQSNISDDQATLITLRQWIDYHDSHNSLERLIELCWRGLDRFTETVANQIKCEVQELLKAANDNKWKGIKGLEERLFGLEELMVDAKKVVDEQSQLASSFQNNRERFSKIKDSTLLPDLSASHKEQLQMMLTNHKKMSDYRNRCIKAKYELSVNIHERLKWIMYIEQQISDLDGKLMIYKENLLRLNRHFEIVDQVHRSPELYLESVVEALRRRRFSRRYLHWANSIVKISQELYENEMNARKCFDTKIGTHFLSGLFPGLARSYPPSFATVQPDPFDTKLPRITAADIQYLQANLSEELASKLCIPKDNPMPHIISAPNTNDEILCEGTEDDLDERHSLNPTPPSSPTRTQTFDD